MKNSIILYRVVLNVLFYIFYVLLASVAFSFIFPTILVILWQEVLDPTNPIFDWIQMGILIIILIFSLIFRKYFYLPIKNKSNIKKVEIKKEKYDSISEKSLNEEKETLSEEFELDIKIGKEIK